MCAYIYAKNKWVAVQHVGAEAPAHLGEKALFATRHEDGPFAPVTQDGTFRRDLFEQIAPFDSVALDVFSAVDEYKPFALHLAEHVHGHDHPRHGVAQRHRFLGIGRKRFTVKIAGSRPGLRNFRLIPYRARDDCRPWSLNGARILKDARLLRHTQRAFSAIHGRCRH